MTHQLNPEDYDWMTAASTRAVMAALNGEHGDRARFVGGCVRNALLREPVDDVDIATVLEPHAATAALESAGIKVIPTGIGHGTITAVVDGEPFEVTSLRRDVETHGRRAVVSFTTDWSEDALRRDFRLNAIYARSDGTLYDPFGGLEDVAARQIVFIGEARDRIAEDHLRILRFYRFNAWYGQSIDPTGHQACSDMAQTLKALSVERIWKELKKLLAAPDPSETVKAMQEGHVLSQVLTERIDFNFFLAIIKLDRGNTRASDPLLRLATLLGGDKAAMIALCKQMRASNAELARVEGFFASAEGLATLQPASDARAIRRGLYAIGAQAVVDQLRLSEARDGGDANASIALAQSGECPVFPIKGQDLIKAGVERGPQMGALLNRLERDWIASDFELSRDALLQRVQGEGS